MFQVDWAQKALWESEKQPIPGHEAPFRREAVGATALLNWEEHCQECAIPTCYTSCSLYVPRADKKCSRFAYGIYPNPQFQGLFDYGADIRFRRWAKLEARLVGNRVSVKDHRLLDRFNRALIRPLPPNNSGYQGPSARFAQNGLAAESNTLLGKLRRRLLSKVGKNAGNASYDEFVMECFSPEPAGFTLILECWSQDMKARRSFEIEPGWNLHKLPAKIFNLDRPEPSAKILLYPENDAQVRLVFTWLDLVEYQAQYRPEPAQSPVATFGVAASPAPKVKCVAWDLDNTLWDGILVEDTESQLSARSDALDLVKKLDERGIIQTVVSKNNFSDAWPVVERLGLKDYFLYPAINWQPKSSNLRSVAKKLNLHLELVCPDRRFALRKGRSTIRPAPRQGLFRPGNRRHTLLPTIRRTGYRINQTASRVVPDRSKAGGGERVVRRLRSVPSQLWHAVAAFYPS